MTAEHTANMVKQNRLWVFWLVFLLPVLVHGDCGSRPLTQARIVGGTEAAVNSWPWQAMLLRYHDRRQFCGGTLVDPLWIVTAAHCVVVLRPSDMFVRMGAHFRVNGTVGTEQDVDVAEIILHQEFGKPLFYSNDIALLKLAKAVNLTDEVGAACLPDINLSLFGKTCWITGWGTLSAGGIQPNTFMQALVPLVSNQICLLTYPNQLDGTMLCAGYRHGGVDACQGDSGGPLVCEFSGRWFLEGITSWGRGCAAPYTYGVYAKVRVFLPWLATNIRHSNISVASRISATRLGGTSLSRSISQDAGQSISLSNSYPPATTPSLIKRSISVSASQTQAITTSIRRTFFTSTTVSLAVSMSVNRGGSLFDFSSGPPSKDQSSISPSLLPKARTIIYILLIGKMMWML